MSTAIVGPLTPIEFWNGAEHPTVLYLPAPPTNTCDPRAEQCIDHHLACDCREAILGEQISEARSDARRERELRDAVRALALIHRPHGGSAYPGPSCTGCHCAWPCPTANLVRPLLRPWELPKEGQ